MHWLLALACALGLSYPCGEHLAVGREARAGSVVPPGVAATAPTSTPRPPLAGRIHPLVVHFPIACLLLALPCALAARRWRALDLTTAVLAACGAGGALAAVVSGTLLASGQDPQALDLHRLAGWMAATLALAAAVLSALVLARGRPRWACECALAGAALAVAAAGHTGGGLAHGAGFPF
jgi:uncharacterized membrane protein